MSIRHMPVRRLLLLPAALAAAGLLLLAGGGRAEAAATITVNTRSGTENGGMCSLAGAIEAANTDQAVDACRAGSGDDVINIAVAGVIKAPSEGFKIKSNVTIQGHADGTTINGGDVKRSAGAVGISLSGGSSSEVVTAVTLADLTISGGAGDGVEVLDQADSTVTASYSVTLENLRVRETSVGLSFGRVPKSGRPGVVRVRDSVFEGNLGGVVMSACDMTPVDLRVEVVNSVVRGNGAGNAFGGIFQGCGHLRVVDSTISENAGHLSGVYVVQYTPGLANLVSRSDDRASVGTTRTEIVNSTVFGNSSLEKAGGVHVERSKRKAPVLSISHSTIADNTTGDSVGGGVHTEGAVTASVVNSVIAGNEGSDGGARSQCGWGAAPTGSVGNVSSDSSCGFSTEGVSPRLGRLRDNGGARPVGTNSDIESVDMGNVLTMAIDVSGPLFNAGDAASCLAKDARGVSRPQRAGCDVGAYEAEVVEIGDHVWEDADGDAVQDAGEAPIAGVRLELVDGDGNVLRTDTTGADGVYGFDVTPGEWTVRVSDAAGVLAGRRATTPTSLSLEVDVGSGHALAFDFGYRPTADAGEPVINVNTLKGAARDGKCALVEALRAAETDRAVDGCVAGSGDDKVHIAVPGEIRVPLYGFFIASNVTVQGNADGTTVSGGRGVFVIVTDSDSPDVAAATAVTLADLTITDTEWGVTIEEKASANLKAAYTVTLENLHVRGSVSSGVHFEKALDSARTGVVSLKDSVIEGNGRTGIWLHACDTRRDHTIVTVTNTVVRSNRFTGVFNHCGHLRLVDSAVYLNSGYFRGGGVYAAGSTQTEIINSTIANNSSIDGGGVSASGGLRPTLSIANSTIVGNMGGDDGGVYTTGSVATSITNSVIARNSGDQCGFGSALAVSKGNAAPDGSCGTAAQGFTELSGASLSALGLLANNGAAAPVGPNGGMGNVPTVAVDGGSLLDGGDTASCQDKDGRGAPRPQGPGCDIGSYEALVIGDRVWEDIDGDGEQDPGEDGIEDVTVELRDNHGNLRGTATTDDDGEYSFVVKPGEWTIRVTDTGKVVSNHQAITAETVNKIVRVDSSDLLDADFGYRPMVLIGDHVWLDADGDRLQDEDERPLGNVTLELRDDQGRVRDLTATDPDGIYSFEVGPGEWTVRVTDNRGILTDYRATTRESITAEVSVGGSDNLNFDFGYAQAATGSTP